jgi:hypothetical protein
MPKATEVFYETEKLGIGVALEIRGSPPWIAWVMNAEY